MSRLKLLMLSHDLNNFEIQRCYQNEFQFNGVYSINNLPAKKNGAHAAYFNNYTNIGSHWNVCYVKNNKTIYFNSFGIEDILKKVLVIKI